MKISARKLNVFYDDFHALINVNLETRENAITAFIGPSGCGKSTLLRCFNRMNDLIDCARVEGEVRLDGKNIYGNGIDLTSLRRKVGMVFQRPTPFPLSIYDNCVYGPRVHGVRGKRSLDDIAQNALSAVLLWDEVKDKLHHPALELSGEAQQRLCIARLLAVKAKILLMDEPCSTLDPIATEKIEELLLKLKKDYTIVIVTHNMQQAHRISDSTGFFLLGEMVEFGTTAKLFKSPKDKRTQDYIDGRFG